MALSAVASTLTSIGHLLTEEAVYLWGVEEEVKRLQKELKWMQSFLIDANAEQGESERFRLWVDDIRDIAYDAKNVVETFAQKFEFKRNGGFSNFMKRSARIMKEGRMRHETRSKIEKIIQRIIDLTRQLQTYGMRELRIGEGSTSADTRMVSRRSYSHIIDDNIVGLDNDIKILVSVLVNEESECRVVSISGMGGLGKTTLAKKVYHHYKVKGQFNHLAWVSVSQQFRRRNVWEGILSCFNILDGEDRNKGDEVLAKKLFNFLKYRKCLVILDDIWSTEAWYRVKPAFPESQTRSKILLTSRNRKIVSYADRRGYLYELQCPKEEESLELLKKIAFRGRDSTDLSMADQNDIRSIEAWDCIKPCFPARETSSKILVTSRTKEIASYADRRGYLHELQGLNCEDSWDSFQSTAFPHRNSSGMTALRELTPEWGQMQLDSKFSWDPKWSSDIERFRPKKK